MENKIMNGLTKLSPKQIEVLRQMVKFRCQVTGKHEDEVGTLEVHRIIRGNVGGKYVPNNIQMVCNQIHKMFHANENRNVNRK